MSPTRVPVTVVVLTFNEARNLEACLASVAGWAAAVVVVDSGSTDGTVELARRHGAHVIVHPFESHARQWRWALNEVDRLGSAPAWTLGLDADQRVTPPLQQSIAAAIAQDAVAPEVDGFFVNRRQIFRGRWIRYGGYYPKYLLKLFRRDRVALDPGELVDHHFIVPGATRLLAGDLIEDNRNEDDVGVWIAKHHRYAARQAEQEFRERAGAASARPARPTGDPDARVRWQKRQWRRLPLFVRPAVYFFYRYILRLGFLDGRQGFVFHATQAFWYRLLVDVHLDRLRRDHAPARDGGRALDRARVDQEARS
jgi:glycosyltransferase involved in cell wall biosynthesis